MNPLTRYQPPVYDLVPDEQPQMIVRGSLRATTEQAFVVVASRLPEVIRSMASADRDFVELEFETRGEGFFGARFEPNARIRIRTSKG